MRKHLLGILGLALCLVLNASASITVDFNDTTSAPFTDFNWTGWNTGAGVASPTAATPTVTRKDGALFSFEGADFSGTGSVTVSGWLSGASESAWTVSYAVAGFNRAIATTIPVNELKFSFQGTGMTMDNFVDFAVVPEPGTVLAGALLLLPFGASAARVLRKKG